MKKNNFYIHIPRKYSFHFTSLVLTLICVGFLWVRFEVGGGMVKLPLPPPRYLKFVRIMLETSHLTREYTHVCSFIKYTKGFLILLILFLCKKSAFLAKVVPLLKVIVQELCYRHFISVFSFCKIKGYF